MVSSNSSKRGRAQDRRSFAAGQEHETAYEAQKTGASPEEVKRAVKKLATAARRWRP